MQPLRSVGSSSRFTIFMASGVCRNIVMFSTAPNAAAVARHLHKVFGEVDTSHMVKFFAHRVQRPHEKINHALLLAGDQGIGKDSLLEPVKHAVGPWNFAEVSLQQMLGRFLLRRYLHHQLQDGRRISASR